MEKRASEINLIIKILLDIPRITSHDAYGQLLDIIREDLADEGINLSADEGINLSAVDSCYFDALKADYINVLKEALTEAENMEILPY